MRCAAVRVIDEWTGEVFREYASQEGLWNRRSMQTQSMAEKKRRDAALECMQFMSCHQSKSTTREWDLNRPDRLRLSRPARLTDDDPKCGVASLQRFVGEDLDAPKTKKAHREQNFLHWDTQRKEKLEQRQIAKQQEMTEAESSRLQDRVRDAVFHDQQIQRRGHYSCIQDANLLALEEKRAQAAAWRQQERLEKEQEIIQMQTSPFLKESVSHNARKECWKGMEMQETDAIRIYQRGQCDEKRAEADRLQRDEKRDAEKRERVDQQAFAAARATECLRREQAQRLAMEHRIQSADKQRRDAARDALYRNKLSPEFHSQLQRSHR